MAKSPYFCLNQQEKAIARKEPIKRIAISGQVNKLIVYLNANIL